MPASDAAMRPPRRALRRCVLLLVYLAASLLFTELHMAWSYGHPAATPEQLMRFEAARPYQYRVLVPALAHLVHGATGLDASASYRLIGVLAGFFLLVAFRGYLSRFVPPAAAASGALAILYPLLWNVSPASPLRFFYPSDVPAVLFTVLGLAALAAERMKLFYLVFAVATLNRETSCFLGFAYLFAGLGRRDLATLSRHLGLQLTIWLAIKLALDTVFAGSPGSLVDLMAPRNAALWSSLLRLEPVAADSARLARPAPVPAARPRRRDPLLRGDGHGGEPRRAAHLRRAGPRADRAGGVRGLAPARTCSQARGGRGPVRGSHAPHRRQPAQRSANVWRSIHSIASFTQSTQSRQAFEPRPTATP
jgi:hypothetical protein